MTMEVSRWAEYQYERFTSENGRDHDSWVIGGGEQFCKEIFARLYEGDGEFNESLKVEEAWAAKAHAQLSDSHSFKRMQESARRDRFGAGVTAIRLTEELLRELVDKQGRTPPTVKLQKVRDEVSDLIDWAKTLEEAGATEKAKEVREKIEKKKAKGKRLAGRYKEFAESIKDSDMVDAVVRATGKAKESMSEASDLDNLAGWGEGEGESTTIGAKQKAELAERVRCTPKLAEIAKLAGRLKTIAASAQRMKPAEGTEVSSIKCGADLGRLLPTELVKLTDPALALDFGKRFTERSLLEYDLKDKRPKGRGPMVICVDDSGSMEGEREVWAKGMTLALLSIARKQKRDCQVVYFSGKISRTDMFEFNAEVGMDTLIESISHFRGGGTNFEKPLSEAHRTIEDDPTFNKADVVFITDGSCDTSDDFKSWWKAQRKQLGFSVFGIHVGAPGGVATGTLKDLTDKTVGIADVANDVKAHEVFSI